MKGREQWLIVVAVVMLLASCGPASAPSTEAPAATSPSETAGRTLTVMTHDSFDVSENVVAAFKERCNCEVQFLQVWRYGPDAEPGHF